MGAPGELPGELADPLVEEEASRQPGDGRRPAQAQGGELGRHPWVVGRQLHRLAQRAHCLLLVPRHHQRARQVDQRLRGLQTSAQRFLAEPDSALAIALDQHQREPVVGEHARVVEVSPPGPLEDLVGRARIQIEQRAALVEDLVHVATVDQRRRRRGRRHHRPTGVRDRLCARRHPNGGPKRVQLGRSGAGARQLRPVVVVLRHHRSPALR